MSESMLTKFWKTVKPKGRKVWSTVSPHVLSTAGLSCFVMAGFFVNIVIGFVVAGLAILLLDKAVNG